MTFKHSLLIGRFQPLHEGHITMIRHGLEAAQRLIIVLGSAHGPRTIKNPFTVEERIDMVRISLDPSDFERIDFVSVRDYHYNDKKWCAEVRNKVFALANKNSLCMIGYPKDYTSYYLTLFRELEFKGKREVSSTNATDIRRAYFDMGNLNGVPWAMQEWLSTFRQKSEYTRLRDEYRDYKIYRDAWSNAPFAPTFLTVDSVVEHNGHILLVERGKNPGKGLLALPGGFIDQTERLLDAAIRETKEETGLVLLKSSLVDQDVFDYPSRSLRGRTITHGFYFIMGDTDDVYPVVGNDDASSAFWMSVPDIYKNEEKFFEDHFHIICKFIERH